MPGPTTAGLTKRGRRPITSDTKPTPPTTLSNSGQHLFCATVVHSLLFSFLPTPMYLGVSYIS